MAGAGRATSRIYKNRAIELILSCEHGGCRVPAKYVSLFRGAGPVLRSHRGYDPGALELARRLAEGLGARLWSATLTRLLVELNRSIGHRALFSEFSRPLHDHQRRELLQQYYHPYRDAVESAVVAAVRKRRTALHVSVHSFAPVLDGVVRRCDVGLLYDPLRPRELAFCRRWQAALRGRNPALVVRRNYPYRGCTDGLTTHLRRRCPKGYLGVELEVNQRFPLGPGAAWRRLQRALLESLQDVVPVLTGG